MTFGAALVIVIAAGEPAWAGRDCDAPAETWHPRSAVIELAERHGWHVERMKIDDGCYEIKGRDAEGRRLKAKIDPASLEIIRIKREHAGQERNRDRAGDR